MRHTTADRVASDVHCRVRDVSGVVRDWNVQPGHQLLYIQSGTVRVEVHDAAWVLPPRRAAWVRAGVVHRVTVPRRARLHAIHIDQRRTGGPPAPVRVFELPDLGREMVLHAARWGPGREDADPVADAFFTAFLALLPDWWETAAPYGLPRGRSDAIRAAVRWTFSQLGNPGLSVDGAARTAGMSVRSFRRRMTEETGQSWRDLVVRARLLRAVEALSDPSTPVREACTAAGYQSLGTFSRSFSHILGASPRAWQQQTTRP